MYSPIHATAGLLIATAIPNPALAFLAGMGSHYILDAIPHGDTYVGAWLTGGHRVRRIATVESVDLGLAAIVVLGLIASHPENWWVTLVAGALGGIMPDLLWGLRFVVDTKGWKIPLLTKFLRRHDRWHSWGHAQHPYDMPFAVGLIMQVVVLATVLWLQL